MAVLGGCSMNDKPAKVSDDVTALQTLIDIPVKLKSAKWELFGTPEYDGGVPGPTDYMTLVAEIEPLAHSEQFTSGTNAQNVYVVPEIARPWISERFQTMLDRSKNSNLNLSTVPGCHDYRTRVKQSGRVVTGFSCEQSGRVLIYLSLS